MRNIRHLVAMTFFIVTAMATFSCDRPKTDGTGAQSVAPQKSWPNTASVNVNGKLEVAFMMGGFDNQGFHMIQHVTLTSGTNKFILRFYPGTKNVAQEVKNPVHLFVDGLKDGLPVTADTDYEVEGILLRKAIEESTNLEGKNSTISTGDQTKLAIKKLVNFMLLESNTAVQSNDARERVVRELMFETTYEQILAGDLKANPKADVLIVQRLDPRVTKAPK